MKSKRLVSLEKNNYRQLLNKDTDNTRQHRFCFHFYLNLKHELPSNNFLIMNNHKFLHERPSTIKAFDV